MIDKSKTISSMLQDGHVIIVLTPTTLLTNEATPKDIGAIAVEVLSKEIGEPHPRDCKPWKNAIGVDDIKQAQTQSNQRLGGASRDDIVAALMAELTII